MPSQYTVQQRDAAQAHLPGLIPDGHLCKRCGLSFPFTADYFYRTKTSLDTTCKECRRKLVARAYAENREAGRLARKAYYEKNHDRMRELQAKYRAANLEQIAQVNREYRARNAERILARRAEYRSRNRAAIRELDNKRYHAGVYREQRAAWKESARERLRAYSRQHHPQWIAASPTRRLSHLMANAIGRALKGKKAGQRWESLVGYTLQDLMAHLEALFLPGMTWENRGEWHIDHIVPKSLFSFDTHSDPAFRECWALSNLQPLWKLDNLRKGIKPGR